jgi:hypothetical protein
VEDSSFEILDASVPSARLSEPKPRTVIQHDVTTVSGSDRSFGRPGMRPTTLSNGVVVTSRRGKAVSAATSVVFEDEVWMSSKPVSSQTKHPLKVQCDAGLMESSSLKRKRQGDAGSFGPKVQKFIMSGGKSGSHERGVNLKTAHLARRIVVWLEKQPWSRLKAAFRSVDQDELYFCKEGKGNMSKVMGVCNRFEKWYKTSPFFSDLSCYHQVSVELMEAFIGNAMEHTAAVKGDKDQGQTGAGIVASLQKKQKSKKGPLDRPLGQKGKNCTANNSKFRLQQWHE